MKQVPGFEEFRFAYGGFTHRVLRKGDGQQPGVLIIQELPGITRETIELAERLHRDGFTVYLPVLFGQPDSPFEPLKNLAKVCVSFEFRVLANRRRGPVKMTRPAQTRLKPSNLLDQRYISQLCGPTKM